MEEVNDVVAFFRQIGWGDMRAWGSDFVGRFRVPPIARLDKLTDAVWTNIIYYRTNYTLIAAVLALWAIFNRPIFLLALLVIAAGWLYVFVVRRFPITVQGRILQRQEKAGALAIASVVVLLLFGCLWATIWVAGFASLLVLLHAAFRPPNLKAKAARMGADARMRVSGLRGGGGSDDEGGDDVEGGGDSDGEDAGVAGRGPVPGRVENRARRREEYAARRAKLQSSYPNIAGSQ